MVSYIEAKQLTSNKTRAKMVALSTDTVDTEHLANGSTVYQLDTGKTLMWDETGGAFEEYVSPEGGGIAGYTGYPVATQTTLNLNKYKFQDGVDAESYINTFAPYVMAKLGQDGSAVFDSIVYPTGEFSADTNYTTYYAVRVKDSQLYNTSLYFSQDKTISWTGVSDDRRLLLPEPPSYRGRDYVLITPANSVNGEWRYVSTLPSLTAGTLDSALLQQLVAVMKQLAAASPNTAVTKYMPLDATMQAMSLQIINTQQQNMISNSRAVASVLNNTTSLALHANDSADAPFASFKHQEVDFDGNKVYDFTIIFGKTKAFIQCTCYTADMFPMG